MKVREKVAIGAILLGVVGGSGSSLPAAASDFEACLKTALAVKPGKVREVEIERDERGTKLYKFEVEDREGKEWKLLVQARSGRLLETEEDVDRGNPAFESGAKISLDEARRIALERVPGKVKEVERKLESEGTPVYEVEIVPRGGGGEREVEIDAVSGSIREMREEEYEIGGQERE
ncbi:PepSY domain-containing protein [Methylacidimicrobium sp. B4]|uniref:PepSY domain-containing protein n=1 Tax=Methylacidimicrobium sp. B4 TaxID=2796139 RepID=UPI001A8DB784|nr:PepSY domain-containing protein [Methylacidimicrobium sp. B4]QSR83978.1 PepSY domain-containing protein [Methylacidimicrobium sp. B4]